VLILSGVSVHMSNICLFVFDNHCTVVSLYHFLRRHELEKKWEYGDRVRKCRAWLIYSTCFFSTPGGLDREIKATVFYSGLAD